MYGLINRALRDWVRSSHGEEAWAKVAERAGADESLFNAMQSYPDEVTYGFVGVVGEELHLESDQILRDFGRFWVVVTAKVHYGAIFEFGGRDRHGLEESEAMRMGLPPAFVQNSSV